MWKAIVVLLLLASLAFADGFVYNGYGGNETQIGQMATDFNYSGNIIRSSLTDGQPISSYGVYGTISGQIGYLIKRVISDVTFVLPTPSTGYTSNQSWLYVNVTVDIPCSMVFIKTWNINGSITNYYMYESSDSNWNINMTGLVYGQISFYQVFATTEDGIVDATERRAITYFITGVVLPLSMTSNQTYYDVGDTILVWCNAAKSTSINEVWLFSSDGSAYNMTYLVTKQMWYIYYRIKQPQEYVSVFSYSVALTPSGYGDLVITINPDKVTKSSWDLMLLNIGYLGASGGVILIAIAVLIIIVVLAKMFITDKMTPKPLAPIGMGRTSTFGRIGGAAMSGASGLRNSGNIVVYIIMIVITLIAIGAVSLVALYLLRMYGIL